MDIALDIQIPTENVFWVCFQVFGCLGYYLAPTRYRNLPWRNAQALTANLTSPLSLAFCKPALFQIADVRKQNGSHTS